MVVFILAKVSCVLLLCCRSTLVAVVLLEIILSAVQADHLNGKRGIVKEDE